MLYLFWLAVKAVRDWVPSDAASPLLFGTGDPLGNLGSRVDLLVLGGANSREGEAYRGDGGNPCRKSEMELPSGSASRIPIARATALSSLEFWGSDRPVAVVSYGTPLAISCFVPCLRNRRYVSAWRAL